MARNAIGSDFRLSKMAQIRLQKWPPAAILENKFKEEKVIFGHPKWPPAAILLSK